MVAAACMLNIMGKLPIVGHRHVIIPGRNLIKILNWHMSISSHTCSVPKLMSYHIIQHQARDISKHFCPLPFFLWGRLSFLRKRINFRSAFWHEYPWIHSWIHPAMIYYVAKTLKLIHYDNTSWVRYRLHCRFMKYSDADHIFWEAMLVALCCRVCALVAQCARLHLTLQMKK